MPLTTLLFDLDNTLAGNDNPKIIIDIIQWAFANDFKVIITAKPAFSRAAVLRQLDSAGISAEEFPYHLIATAEILCFTKPAPEYFAAALALVDSRPAETLLLGADWLQDIVPAYQLGIHPYWISPSGSHPIENHARPAGIGRLTDFLQWARAPNNLVSLPPRPSDPRAVRAQQAASPIAISALTDNLPPANWKRRPRETEWSLTEIACHLRDVEIEVNLPRLKKIRDEPTPFISAVESDSWAIERDYQSQAGLAALAAFADARGETLNLLDRLSPAEWQRLARHAIFGPTTLQELATVTVEHDRVHLRQVQENLL